MELSAEEYFELMDRLEVFKTFLDRFSFGLIRRAFRPGSVYGAPPQMFSQGRGSRSAWPKRDTSGNIYGA